MSLVVWLPLINNIENQGNSNITITNNGATSATGGKLGNCYYFNGSAQYLQFSDTLGDIYVKDFTWAVWLKPTDSTRGVICSEYSAAGTSGIAFELTASLGLRIWWNGSPDIYPSNCTLTKDIWQHVAICKTTNKLEFYINGGLRATYTGTLSDRTSTAKIRIGDDYRGGTSVSYMGYINDFRLYDHALSPREVKEISKGLILHYSLADRYIQHMNNVFTNPRFEEGISGWSTWAPTGSSGTRGTTTDKQWIYRKDQTNAIWIACSSTSTSYYILYQSPSFAGGYRSLSCICKREDGGPPQWYDEETGTIKSALYPGWNANVPDTHPQNRWDEIIPLGDNFYYCKCNGFQQDGSNDLVCVTVNPGFKVYVCEMYLENNRRVCSDVLCELNEETDSSGYLNNAQLNGSFTVVEDAPRYSISTVFNGTNNYLSANALPAETYTLSVWIKTTWKDSSSFKLAVYSTSSKLAIGFSGDHLVSYIGSTTGGAGSSVSTSNYVADEWNHIVVVKTGETTRTVYINGQVASNVSNNWWGDGGVTNLFIGARYYSSYRDYFDGQLSDFRAYATVLSQEDILELYHTSASVSDNGTLFAYTFNEE